jgi:hypothetical protein
MSRSLLLVCLVHWNPCRIGDPVGENTVGNIPSFRGDCHKKCLSARVPIDQGNDLGRLVEQGPGEALPLCTVSDLEQDQVRKYSRSKIFRFWCHGVDKKISEHLIKMWYKYRQQVPFFKKAAGVFQELKGEKNRPAVTFDLAAMRNHGLCSEGHDAGC